MSADWAETAKHLIAGERALVDPAVRRDRAKVGALLAEDFVEFGSSGQVWNRQTILDLLEGENEFTAPALEEMRCEPIGPDAALVTYKTVGPENAGARNRTLRSSIWVRKAGLWKVRFHQGTKVA
jgi:ribonuclease HI